MYNCIVGWHKRVFFYFVKYEMCENKLDFAQFHENRHESFAKLNIISAKFGKKISLI
jgi:hypothetical protein